MEAAQARLSIHLSKYHIVGNNMSWLKCLLKKARVVWEYFGSGMQILNTYPTDNEQVSIIPHTGDLLTEA